MLRKKGKGTLYRIVVRSELTDSYASAFEGMEMQTKNGQTILSGEVKDQPHLFVILGIGDPEYGVTLDALMTTALEMFAYAQALGDRRRADPTDDLTSVLMGAEVDGERLTSQ
ncbi:MAG TPA: hypothetical protein VFH16_01180, partial [Rubrobacter sp.]|nr:hypothetical protein [Rubrobacter sp.]